VTWWLQRVIDRFSTRETLNGMDVALFMPISAAERSLIFGKVRAALALVETHAPRRFATLRRDMRQLLVCGRPDAAAQYDAERQLCELSVHWVTRDDVSPELVASAIVHEAEHARLWRLGLRYTPEQHARIERLCHRAERVFGKRLPNGAGVVAQAEAGMLLDAHFYGRDQRAVRERMAIQQLADASPLVRPLLWVYDLRAWLRGRRRSRSAAQQRDEADEAREG
jgi:hypothetical protein